MKKFEEFLKKRIIKKQSPNEKRALSLLKEATNKKEFLEIALKTITKMNTNFVCDHSYDIIMELIRANMFMLGYNAGGSHEAEVSYLGKLGFSDKEVQVMDQLRYYRNGIKYYGTILTEEYAKQVLKFLEKIYPKLKKLV